MNNIKQNTRMTLKLDIWFKLSKLQQRAILSIVNDLYHFNELSAEVFNLICSNKQLQRDFYEYKFNDVLRLLQGGK